VVPIAPDRGAQLAAEDVGLGDPHAVWHEAPIAASGFGWPLIIAGALKIVCDLLLLAMFRKVRPPEERPSPT
jgi:hypothetical protein